MSQKKNKSLLPLSGKNKNEDTKSIRGYRDKYSTSNMIATSKMRNDPSSSLKNEERGLT